MALVNIRRDVDDQFYRYRMPALTTKIEGKGNGIKTVILNMSDVARALNRPPTYITKFLGYELGAQTNFDEKHDRYIVNGAHHTNRLHQLLDVFIDKFVLCKACRNPETELIVQKLGRTEKIIRDCKACGKRTDIDMRHRLTTFIVKNSRVKIKKGKNKNTSDAAGVGGTGNPDPNADRGESPKDDGKRTTNSRSRQRLRSLTDTALSKEDWSADTSAEAVKQRTTKAFEGSMAALVISGDDDGGSDDDAQRR